MALPAYIPVRTVGFRGVLELEQGKGLTAKVAVRSSGSLRWADTGELFETLGGTFTSGRGASVTFPLPVTDDDGWLTTANETIDVSEGGTYTHTYTATVVVMDASGRQVGDVYEYGPFVVPASESTLWLDELEQQITVAGSVVARPTVYSVNGQDGAVTITAAGLGAYVKPGTGVPKTDLASAVQTSLGKADSAVQPADVGTMAAEDAADYLTATETNAAIGEGAASVLVGQTDGSVVQPWRPAEAFGLERWVAAKFLAGGGRNTTQEEPSLTANGTSQTLITWAPLGNTVNQDRSFRLVFTPTVPVDGTSYITVRMVNTAGTTIPGTVEQVLWTRPNGSGGPSTFEFSTYRGGASGEIYLEVKMTMGNNSTSGVLSLTDVSLREIARPRVSLRVFSQPDGPRVATSLWDPRVKDWRMAITSLAGDGVLARALHVLTAYSVRSPFRYDGAEPTFSAAQGSAAQAIPGGEVVLSSGELSRSLRANNNDQIFGPVKQDGTTLDLVGNTHGGETIRAEADSLVYRIDPTGNGDWYESDLTGYQLRDARRFQFIFNTQVARSAPDSDVFAHVDHTATFFPDGMMRMDRTTRFLKDIRLSVMFDWMSSHDLTVPHVGRVGRGLLVEGEVDAFPKLTAPVMGTVTTETTDGALAAATYGYVVTALSDGGETTPSAAGSVTTTGSTSKNTVLWTAVAGAQGYRIYGRSNLTMRKVLLATVGPNETSWVDDGSQAASGPLPPSVNTARVLTSTTTEMDRYVSGSASWAVWYDPILNMCFGNIYDREEIAAREGVASVVVRLERGSGIKKNYVNVIFEPDGGSQLWEQPARTITEDTVWAATHWSYTYIPADPDQYHLEIAARAANLATLKTMYPTS